MTAKELLLYCWMAYIDLPPLYASLLARGGGIPVAALADTALRMDEAGILKCAELNDAARAAARELLESDGVITGYINENASDGFVAYTIKTSEAVVVAMRGSERLGPCVSSNVDWIDNVCEPFTTSVQLNRISKLVATLPDGKVIFTGHSKGGHNALVALVQADRQDVSAEVFNAQGFAADALTSVQADMLAQNGVNYVVADDIVGALLYHPEKRVFVKQVPGTNAHMPEAFAFDNDGAPVTAYRSIRSYAVERLTQFADARIEDGRRESIGRICRGALERYGV